MLSKNAPDKFSFHSCNFKVQKCKEGTGRVVMWRMGILNSYTMESTFGGSTLGNKRDTHFTTEDLKSLGYHVCDTLLDFCDPDRTKFMQCLAELKELLQQEIRKKFNEFGQDMDLEGSWSDISLSDIESSTSGSDSSLSDGLPLHLLNTAHEVNQKTKMYKKKKRSQDVKANQPGLDQQMSIVLLSFVTPHNYQVKGMSAILSCIAPGPLKPWILLLCLSQKCRTRNLLTEVHMRLSSMANLC